MSVPFDKRFSARGVCPVCGGHAGLPRGKGVRCSGYWMTPGTDGGRAVVCTRRAEGAVKEISTPVGTGWVHRVDGGAEAPLLPAVPSPRGARKKPKGWESPAAFGAWLKSREGWRAGRMDMYQDAEGADVMAVLRFDLPAAGGDEKPAKEYRPMHVGAGGRWFVGDPRPPLPIFNLPAILAAEKTETVYVVEGEKAASAGSYCGLLTTTSAHGAKSVTKTDWAPLKGRDVVILPDNDEAGGAYARAVADVLLERA